MQDGVGVRLKDSGAVPAASSERSHSVFVCVIIIRVSVCWYICWNRHNSASAYLAKCTDECPRCSTFSHLDLRSAGVTHPTASNPQTPRSSPLLEQLVMRRGGSAVHLIWLIGRLMTSLVKIKSNRQVFDMKHICRCLWARWVMRPQNVYY